MTTTSATVASREHDHGLYDDLDLPESEMDRVGELNNEAAADGGRGGGKGSIESHNSTRSSRKRISMKELRGMKYHDLHPMESNTDPRDSMARSSVKSSQLGIEQLRQRVKELEEENAVLKRNISTLYRTSREEIKRKDMQIAALQENELDKTFQNKE